MECHFYAFGTLQNYAQHALLPSVAYWSLTFNRNSNPESSSVDNAIFDMGAWLTLVKLMGVV